MVPRAQRDKGKKKRKEILTAQGHLFHSTLEIGATGAYLKCLYMYMKNK